MKYIIPLRALLSPLKTTRESKKAEGEILRNASFSFVAFVHVLYYHGRHHSFGGPQFSCGNKTHFSHSSALAAAKVGAAEQEQRN